jgi:peptide/nickel transport system ATP-binding protein
MYAGQIVEMAEAAAFFAAPRHPYARLLLEALPDAGKRGGALAAIGGSVPPLWQEFPGCRFVDRCDRAFDACPSVRPALVDVGGSGVRCLLYVDRVASGWAPVPAAARAAATAAPLAPASPPATAALPASAPTVAVGTRTPPGPLLEVGHLSVRFPIRSGLLQRARGEFVAVDDVSFTVGPGETLALVGESGCGKTTTGKAIVQLLRGRARIDGTACLDGVDLFGLHDAALKQARRSIQIVFQDPYASLNPRLRVGSILEEGLQALQPDADPAARRASIAVLLDQVGLRRDVLERYPHEFSGGQRQRIAIARALAVRPRLLVCDEPTSALDVSVQGQILNLLRELQRELGMSYLFITHNIGVVEYLADRVAVMNRGRIEESGPVDAVLQRPQSPYTRELLAAVPRIEAPAASG